MSRRKAGGCPSAGLVDTIPGAANKRTRVLGRVATGRGRGQSEISSWHPECHAIRCCNEE